MCQDTSAAMELEEKDLQVHRKSLVAGGFCALKMQYVANICQFIIAICLASEVASPATLSFNIIVAVRPKEV